MAVIELNSENFDAEVLNEKEKLVVVDFWSPTCPPCLTMGPIFEKLSNELTDVKFCKVKVDENQELAVNHGVMSIPNFKFFKNGSKIDEIIGAMPEEVFKEKINTLSS